MKKLTLAQALAKIEAGLELNDGDTHPTIDWSSFTILPDGRSGEIIEEGRTVYLPTGLFTVRMTRAEISADEAVKAGAGHPTSSKE